jgi:hypothetical protein
MGNIGEPHTQEEIEMEPFPAVAPVESPIPQPEPV